MVPKLLDSQLCLILLLGFVAMVGSFDAPPGNFTPTQWFRIQHVNMTNPRCTIAMRSVNHYKPQCKPRNTFLNTTYPDVVKVCGTPNIPCPTNPTRKNCHKSSVPVRLTDCHLTSRPTPVKDCKYSDKPEEKFYVVACNNRDPRDSPLYPVVPVHLDAIV
uniref:Eosinophil cationic protein n=2 Tax=Otolemur garnettii TaxID=30611 RepID=H0XSR6_OTOGA